MKDRHDVQVCVERESLLCETRVLWRVDGGGACDGHVPLPQDPVLHTEPIDKALKRVKRRPGGKRRRGGVRHGRELLPPTGVSAYL